MNSSNIIVKLSSMFYVQPTCGTTSAAKLWKWDISQLYKMQCLHTRNCHLLTTKANYALLVLNRPISQKQDFITHLWNNAAVRITVDGGTNRWDTYVSALSDEAQRSLKPPDLITGDFDSIAEDIIKKYKAQGCKIIHTPDQDYTDFTKALMELNTYCRKTQSEMDHIIAIAQASGRIDQILGNIQTLFLARDKHLIYKNTKLYLMSDDAISWLLSPGEHAIYIPEDVRNFKKNWCSLVPLGENCESVSTTGLKWNLDNTPLAFGDLVSTSNRFNGEDVVRVVCSHTLLWSMRVPALNV